MSGEWLAGLAIVVIVVAVAVWAVAGGGRRAQARKPPYIAALEALVDGDETTAIAELKNTVRADTSNVDAYLRLGDLFRRHGDAERALQLHRELASRPGLPQADLAKVHLALCRDHVALGRPQRAVEAAREAARLADDPSPALEQLLAVQEELEDAAGAFQTKKDILRRTGRAKSGARELADYRAGQAEKLIEAGDLKEAERVLREARKIDGASPRSRRMWGALRESLGDYSGAVEAWQSLLDEQADADAALFADLERVRFLDGSFSEMEDTYNRFLERSPGHEAASFALARFLRRKGQPDAALSVCSGSLRTHPDSVPLRVLWLSLLLQSQRSAEAEAELNEWISEATGGARPETDDSAVETVT